MTVAEAFSLAEAEFDRLIAERERHERTELLMDDDADPDEVDRLMAKWHRTVQRHRRALMHQIAANLFRDGWADVDSVSLK